MAVNWMPYRLYAEVKFGESAVLAAPNCAMLLEVLLTGAEPVVQLLPVENAFPRSFHATTLCARMLGARQSSRARSGHPQREIPRSEGRRRVEWLSGFMVIRVGRR